MDLIFSINSHTLTEFSTLIFHSAPFHTCPIEFSALIFHTASISTRRMEFSALIFHTASLHTHQMEFPRLFSIQHHFAHAEWNFPLIFHRTTSPPNGISHTYFPYSTLNHTPNEIFRTSRT